MRMRMGKQDIPLSQQLVMVLHASGRAQWGTTNRTLVPLAPMLASDLGLTELTVFGHEAWPKAKEWGASRAQAKEAPPTGAEEDQRELRVRSIPSPTAA